MENRALQLTNTGREVAETKGIFSLHREKTSIVQQRPLETSI
jgi:hypothetical protein